MITCMRKVLLFLLASSLMAQRVFEKDHDVIYENAQRNEVNLGAGFSPVLTAQGKVVFVRGHLFDYGEDFDCSRKETKNWISVFDPATRSEEILFDRALSYGREGLEFCVFEQMQLSTDGSTLYLVSPVYATSGSMAIVHLRQGKVAYVPGVNEVYVIESGPHRGELIYSRRLYCRADHGEWPSVPMTIR